MRAARFVLEVLLFHVAPALRALRQGDRPGRREIRAEYLRLRARQIAGALLRRPWPRRVRVLGAEIECLDYHRLVAMFEETFVRGVYEFATTRARPLILDGGSNVGLSVLFFVRRHPGARVVAFEPEPRAFEALERAVRVNGWSTVVPHRLALAGAAGPATLHVDPDCPGSPLASTRAERLRGVPVPVEAAPLSRFVTEPVDFLKLDVEGAELAVLEELETTGRLDLVREMAVEYHHHVRSDEDRLSRLLGLLEAHGYGYELSVAAPPPGGHGRFQDVLVRAYRRGVER